VSFSFTKYLISLQKVHDLDWAKINRAVLDLQCGV
jgi:hypothetical protein